MNNLFIAALVFVSLVCSAYSGEVSDSLEQVQANPEGWSRIEPYPIFLGALTLENTSHLQEIANLGVTWIIDVE